MNGLQPDAKAFARSQLIGALMSGSEYKWKDLVAMSGDANMVDEVIAMLKAGDHIKNRDSGDEYPVAVWSRK